MYSTTSHGPNTVMRALCTSPRPMSPAQIPLCVLPQNYGRHIFYLNGILITFPFYNNVCSSTSYTIVYRTLNCSANKSPTFMREHCCYFIRSNADFKINLSQFSRQNIDIYRVHYLTFTIILYFSLIQLRAEHVQSST